MVGLGNIDDVYKHYLKVIDENEQLKEYNTWQEAVNSKEFKGE